MDNKINIIASNIRAYRARSGLTQQEVAEKLGVSRVTYNDYEVNPQKLKIETLIQIANVLNCKLDDFFVDFNVTERNK